MHRKELLIKALNVVLFNMAWALCVLGGNDVALVTVVVVLILHMLFVAPDWSEIVLLVMIASLGIAIDTLWFLTGVLQNPDGSSLLPIWLVALWFCFSTTCAHCFSFLHNRLLLASLLGAVFGSFSYWAGVRLSDVSFGVDVLYGVLMIAALWCVLFPATLMIAKAFGRGKEVMI